MIRVPPDLTLPSQVGDLVYPSLPVSESDVGGREKGVCERATAWYLAVFLE